MLLNDIVKYQFYLFQQQSRAFKVNYNPGHSKLITIQGIQRQSGALYQLQQRAVQPQITHAKSLYKINIGESLQRISFIKKITFEESQGTSITCLIYKRQIQYQGFQTEGKSQHHKILELLEKKLKADNIKQQKQEIKLRESKSHSPTFFSKATLKQQSLKQLTSLRENNKLFLYFQESFKKQIPTEKVQKQKVNFWERQFQEIRSKVIQKLQQNKLRLGEQQNKLSRKYLQLHKYQSEIKQVTWQLRMSQKKALEASRQKGAALQQSNLSLQKGIVKCSGSLKPPSLKEILNVIEGSIDFLKREISAIEEEIQITNLKGNEIEQQWVVFLKLFINYGYYLTNGPDSIFAELNRLKVKLHRTDLLTELLDDKAKQYFMAYYSNFNSKYQNQDSLGTLSKQNLVTRDRIKSDIQMTSLLGKSNLKEIYSNTKQAVTNLLKRQSFRSYLQVRDVKQSFLPKIHKNKLAQVNKRKNSNFQAHYSEQKILRNSVGIQKQKFLQVNRLNHIYFGNGQELQAKGKQMKRILFGFSVK